MSSFALLFVIFFHIILIVIVLLKTTIVVPQEHEYIVERLGKYYKTLEAGFHFLIPFTDYIAYRRNLKEQSIDLGIQSCVTADNKTVEMDGIMHIQVINSRQSAYGVKDYRLAACPDLAPFRNRQDDQLGQDI